MMPCHNMIHGISRSAVSRMKLSNCPRQLHIHCTSQCYSVSLGFVCTAKCRNSLWLPVFCVCPQRPWIHRQAWHASWIVNSVQLNLGKIEFHCSATLLCNVTLQLSQVNTRSFVWVHRVILLARWWRLDCWQPAAWLVRWMCRSPVTLKKLP